MGSPKSSADDLRALLVEARANGYAVEAVKLPNGIELRLRALPEPEPPRALPRPLPRQAEESDDAYAQRMQSAQDAEREREAKLKRYTRELGPARAAALLDRLP